MDTRRAFAALAEFTADQWGLVTSAQATAADVDPKTLTRLVDAGLLEHVRRGVYAISAAPEDPLRGPRAVWLQLNAAVPAWQRPLFDPDGGVASHRTAAWVHDLGDLLLGRYEFITPHRRTTRHADVALHRTALNEHDVTTVDGLPVTTAERTIADLLADRIDGGHAGDLIYQAIRHGKADRASLAERIGRYARRYGVPGQDGQKLLPRLLEQAGKSMPAPASSLIDVLQASLDEKRRAALDEAIATAIAQNPQLRRLHNDLARAVLSSPAVRDLQQRLGAAATGVGARATQETLQQALAAQLSRQLGVGRHREDGGNSVADPHD